MSYGPGPTSVGTLFMNANNSVASLPTDSTSTPGNCDSCKGDGGGEGDTGGGDGGGGGGSCGDSGGNQVLPLFGPTTGGGNPQGNRVFSKFGAVVVLPIFPGRPFPPCQGAVVPLGAPPGAERPAEPLPPDAPTGLQAGCVAPESRVALFPEGCLAAEEVQPGDMLLTHRADGTFAGEVVTAIRPSTQPRLLLETEAGHRLHCSLSHEIMVADPTLPQGRRTLVSEVTLADRLLQEDGTPIAIGRITPQPDGPVIQISLSGPEHLYLSEGVWSHNKISIQWPSPIVP